MSLAEEHYTAQLYDGNDTSFAVTMLMRASSEQEARRWATKAAHAMGMIVVEIYPTPNPPKYV